MTLKTIRAMRNKAVRLNYLKDNPIKEVTFPRVQTNPPRILSKSEVERLLSAAEKSPLYPLVATALFAGLRKGELINLDWEDIDFKQNLITVKNKDWFTTKNQSFRVIPLNRRLKDILQAYRKPSGSCFPNSEGRRYNHNLLRDFKVLCRKVDIGSCSLHQLRHMLLTWGISTLYFTIRKIAIWLSI
jgi:integrase